MSSRTIYLVRHGQHDRTNRDGDKREGSLTPLGRRQARIIARRLSALPIDAIYSSTLRRAVETAGVIAAQFDGIPVRQSPDLVECIPGLPAAFSGYFIKQYPPDVFAKGLARAERAFKRYFKQTRGRDRHEVIVCHGNLIRYFVCRAMQVQTDAWMNLDIGNGGLSIITVEATGHIVVISHNDMGHMPLGLRTFL